MRAVETVARALARSATNKSNGFPPGEERDIRIERAVEREWPEYERDAANLLRSLKGQPPHVIDAGMTGGPVANLGRPHDPNHVLDQQLEAMARS